jgi:hypothetical protein
MNMPAISGQVQSYATPSAVASAQGSAARGFFDVLRDLLHKVPVFHNESDLLNALAKIDAYEKHVVNSNDLRVLLEEGGYAPVEDVSKRTPPVNYAAATMAAAGPIDYAKLAAAIVVAQQAAAEAAQAQATGAPAPGPVPNITSVPQA